MYGLSPGLLSRGRVVVVKPSPPVTVQKAPLSPHSTPGQRHTAKVAASRKRRAPRPLTQPLLYPLDDKFWRLALLYDYVWHDELKTCKILIDQCFDLDAASVPRLAWTLSGITPTGLISAAATVHDALYCTKGRAIYFRYYESEPCCDIWTSANRVFTRLEADKLFHRIMREAGIGPIKAYAAYRMVRIFGVFVWGS